MITAPVLDAISRIRHGFFTRQGGGSSGMYASLNTGLGSDDDREIVLSNRSRVAKALGADDLVTPYQHHSNHVMVVTKAWDWCDPPRADASVTASEQIAIAINTADCTPVLFSSSDGQVIGAAHAGWKGALGGVLEATVDKMETLGARRSNITAVIGPTISKVNYEVGPEFHRRFVDEDARNGQFFRVSMRAQHFMFDLPGYVADRLSQLGLRSIDDLALCTYGDEERFFSYRRTTHRGEPDYGRQMSAIMIAR